MAWSVPPSFSWSAYSQHNDLRHISPPTRAALKIEDLLCPIDTNISAGPVSIRDYTAPIDFSRHIHIKQQSSFEQTLSTPQRRTCRTPRSDARNGEPTRQEWEAFLQRTEADDRQTRLPSSNAGRNRQSRSLSTSHEAISSCATSEHHDEINHSPGVSPIIPVSSPPPSVPAEYNYILSFRQQPIAARACGHGDRDRRVIDPPPILELKITHKSTGAPSQDSNALFAMHCSLKDAETGKSPAAEYDPRRMSSNMMGASAASPFYGKDEYGRAGTFFVFSDLSCRLTGRFRLNFTLLRVDMMNLQPGAKHLMVASIDSEIFTSYTAKEFPGMQASTPLLIRLREQGLSVGIKKGSTMRISKRRGRSCSTEGDRRSTADELDGSPSQRARLGSTSSGPAGPKMAEGRRSKKRKRPQAGEISLVGF